MHLLTEERTESMIKEIQNKVKAYIERYELLTEGDKVIVGVSGGADSIALLHLLYEMRQAYALDLEVAHIHHGLRKAADQEMQYVQTLCEQLGLICHVHHCDIGQVAKALGMSEEAAGREERYKFFISLTNDCAKIATAHTMNDQAETMIMRFVRGTDVKGLGGIRPKRANIIRPILGLDRREVERYCELKNLHYYQDESNFSTKYTRNKIRLECLPYIKTHFNEKIVKTLSDHAELYQQEEFFLEKYVSQRIEEIVLFGERQAKVDIEKLMAQEMYIQKKLMMQVIERLQGSAKDFSLVHISDCLALCKKQSGKAIHLPHQLSVTRIYETLLIEKQQEVIFTNHEDRLQLGINNIEELDVTVICRLIDMKTFEQTKQNMYTKYIDYDKIKDNLRIRTKLPGDVIVLEYGSKKVKKLLSDAKIPMHARERLPMIVDGEKVVWVVGLRLSSQYFITKDTRHILEIKILNRKAQEGLC